MVKQTPIRNQRSRRFTVKHALQICLMLAICMWLLYQLNQFYGKKAALSESTSRQASKKESGHEIFKLGRKDLNTGLEEIAAEFEKSGEEEDFEQEDGERKLGKEEGRVGGDDDEINGREEGEEEEPEQLEDLIDEGDKIEEGNKEDKVEKENYIENVGFFAGQNSTIALLITIFVYYLTSHFLV